MKRRILLSIISMACMTTVCIADPITPDKAAQLAAKYMTDKANQPKLVKAGKHKSSIRIKKTQQECAPYYIYSRGENQGFVIVSGDDALPEVLGYTNGGNFDEANMPPFLEWYLDYYGSAAEAAQAAGAPRMAAPSMAAAAGRVDISPLIQTHWHQTGPYNDKCPTRKDGGGRCLTGCVATAASQVLYYWHKDLTDETLAGTGSYIYGDQMNATTAFPKGTKIKWDLMRPQYAGSEPAEYKDAVATLLAVVGGGAGLTYGSSTAGHNDNCRAVFSNIFGINGGKENNKDWGEEYNNYSDDAWSTLLYNELINSRPILYSGCNSKGEGHAVVVDGYQASTGYFHFNLGWGDPNTWDGYFTVARGKSPAWQGYNASWQECVTGVYPKKTRLEAELKFKSNFYFNRNNPVSVEVKNKGTLDYKGIYVFVNTTGAKPARLTDAKASNTDFVFANDQQAYSIDLDVKPTTVGKCYIIVTDASLNVLAKVVKESILPESKLYLKSMSVYSSTDSEQHAGETYNVLYNTKATANIVFEDKSGMGYEGTPRLAIYESTDNGATFNYIGYKSAKLSVPANAATTLSIAITSTTSCPIAVGNLYYGVFVNPITGTKTEDYINMSEATDTIVRFVLKDNDMAVESFENGVLKLTGMWDYNAFSTLARKSAYKTATAYDLTSVTKIDEIVPLESNPNMLFYVAADSKAHGPNIVKDGTCEQLVLTVGHDFVPQSSMKAVDACVNLGFVPSKWCIFTAPCDLDVPDGIIARQVDSHISSGISGKTTDVKQLKAGCTYLVMTTSATNQVLYGHNVDVAVAPGGNPDEVMVGTFVNAEIPEGAFIPNDAEPQYFDPVAKGETVKALGGYFYASNVKKSFRAYSQLASDPTFLNLSKNINSAHQIHDEYAAYVTPDVLRNFEVLIDSAEMVFSDRTTYGVEHARRFYNALDDAMTEFSSVAYNPYAEWDCTSMIVNPSFELGTTRGWTTTGRVVRADNLTYKSVDADGQYCMYCCKTDSTADELSQTITGLRPGVYRLSAMVGTTDGHSVTIFAGDSTATAGAHKLGVHYLSKVSIEDIEVGQDGELTLGVKAGFFYKVDDFRLVLVSAADEQNSNDTNGDGTIDTQDVLAIYEFIQNPDSATLSKCDVNGDGVVDTQDVLAVYEYISSN